MLAETHQALRDLLGRRHPEIANNSAVQCSRIIKVDHALHEIGTIAREQFVHTHILSGIQVSDQFVVLLLAGFDLESVAGAIVRRADQLNPWALRNSALGCIRNKFFEMLPAILIAQKGSQLRVCVQWNLLGKVYRIQVRNERNRKPVIAGNPMRAADDDPLLSGFAAPQLKWRVRAHPVEINRNVTGARKGAIHTVGFFEKQRRARMGLHAAPAEEQKHHCTE